MTTAIRSLLVAITPALVFTSCTSGPPTADSIYEGRASRYGDTSRDTKPEPKPESNRYGAGSADREEAREASRNRFGYGESNEEAEESVPAPATRERSDRRRPADAEPETVAGNTPDPKPVDPPKEKPTPATSSSSTPPALSDMPYARGVPGNPLAVTIPGFSYVGEVSIEKLDKSGNPAGEPQAPGTAVSIPDPKSPGKSIYFRVP